MILQKKITNYYISVDGDNYKLSIIKIIDRCNVGHLTAITYILIPFENIPDFWKKLDSKSITAEPNEADIIEFFK